MRSAQHGDRAALETLLRLHHDRVYGLCRRLAGNDADGADATQEALIAIVRGLPRVDGRSSFSTWVYRVATNAAVDELRRRRRRRVVSIPDGVEETATAPPVDRAVTDRLVVDDALTRLPEEFRVAVVLRDLCDLDYAEIAAVLDIPPGTVRSRIARGRAANADYVAGNQTTAPQRPTSEP